MRPAARVALVTCAECFLDFVSDDGVECADCARPFCTDECHADHAAACAAEGVANA